MIEHFEEGRICLKIPQLKSMLVSMAAKSYIKKMKGVTKVDVASKEQTITICYDPQILPTKTLLKMGKENMAKYGLDFDIPAEVLAMLEDDK